MDKAWLIQQDLPRHVAIVMDGNGRWAQKRFLPRVAGHRAGVETVRMVVSNCVELGIDALTLFAFSSENWLRPLSEVNFLMNLFQSVLKKELKKLHEHRVRLRVIGEISALNPLLQQLIGEAEELTASNQGLQFNLAVNYGGRWDILQAARDLAEKVKKHEITVEDITEEHFTRALSIADCPAPDLFIRTSGERRISNFLLWQLAYTELSFVDVMWPEFSEQHFFDALVEYTKRTRRFGRVEDQYHRA